MKQGDMMGFDVQHHQAKTQCGRVSSILGEISLLVLTLEHKSNDAQFSNRIAAILCHAIHEMLYKSAQFDFVSI